jgi:arabinose-5-phosphate isomerase
MSTLPKRATTAASPLQSARRTLEIEARAVEALAARWTTALPRRRSDPGLQRPRHRQRHQQVRPRRAQDRLDPGQHQHAAFFLHPAEASHGDLGMITAQDVMIALSNSGESAELLAIVPHVKRRGASLIAVTGNARSTLAREADVHLDAGVAEEACPLGLAPTASTTAALALGDALAVALLEARGFGPEDFARSHPGGSLGRRLLTHVSDVMRKGDAVPVVPRTALLSEAILEMSRKGMGMTAVIEPDRRVAGIFTDGDLRRTLEKPLDVRITPIENIMTERPRTILPNRLAAEAVKLMEDYRVSQILVVDDDYHLVGALNTHDLFRAMVI